MPLGHLSLLYHGGRGLDFLFCMLVPCETVTGLSKPLFNRNWKVKPNCTLKSQDAHLHLIWRLPFNLAFQANRELLIHTCLYIRVILLRRTCQVDNLPLGGGPIVLFYFSTSPGPWVRRVKYSYGSKYGSKVPQPPSCRSLGKFRISILPCNIGCIL